MGSCAFPENKWQSLGDWKEEDFADRYPSSIIADFVDAVMNDREPLVNGHSGRGLPLCGKRPAGDFAVTAEKRGSGYVSARI